MTPPATTRPDVIVRRGGDLVQTSSATFSRDGHYRYLLTREWDEEPLLAWVMLNPSTADQDDDDPTITRISRRARGLGYGGIAVVNLYALRSAYPERLAEVADPVGPHNDEIIRGLLTGDIGNVVLAWGSHQLRTVPGRAAHILDVLDDIGLTPLCLGVNKDGQPKHPLYVSYETGLTTYQRPQEAP